MATGTFVITSGAGTVTFGTTYKFAQPTWTPTMAPPERGYGPQATGGGSLALSTVQEPEIIEETIPIHIFGATMAARLASLQTLKRVLSGAEYTIPARMTVEPYDPSSGVGPVYFEILHGDVQERQESTFGAEHTQSPLKAEMRLTRRALGGAIDTSETIINALSYTNVHTSNLRAISPTKGDLLYSGQPVNMTITPVSSATAARIYLASTSQIKRDTSGWAAVGPLGSGYSSLGVAAFDIEDFLTQYPVAVRLVARLATVSGAACNLKANCALNSGSTYYTADVSLNSVGTTTTGRFIDFGDIPVPITPGLGISGAQTLNVDIQGTGSGSTVTVAYAELLFYYEWCVIQNLALTSTVKLALSSFPENVTGRSVLPFAYPVAHQFRSNASDGRAPLLGQAPRARPNTQIWMVATTSGWAGEQDTAFTYTVSATQAPLWRTLRGEA